MLKTGDVPAVQGKTSHLKFNQESCKYRNVNNTYQAHQVPDTVSRREEVF